jgi:hypothetical protein
MSSSAAKLEIYLDYRLLNRSILVDTESIYTLKFKIIKNSKIDYLLKWSLQSEFNQILNGPSEKKLRTYKETRIRERFNLICFKTL